MAELVKIGTPIEIKAPGSRITLKQFTLADAGEIFDLINRNREHLSQFGDDTSGKYPTYESVTKSISHPKNPNKLRFAIRDLTGTYVGTINITPDKDDKTHGEVGYYIGSEFQGRGFTTEAARLLSDFAFSELGYSLLYAKVHPDNTGSQRVLLKAGFSETGMKDGDKIFAKSRIP